MIDVNQLRRGVNFLHGGELFKVTEYSHSKPGRGKATIRVSVRNMRSGANLQLTFTSGPLNGQIATIVLLLPFQLAYEPVVFANTGKDQLKEIISSIMMERLDWRELCCEGPMNNWRSRKRMGIFQ